MIHNYFIISLPFIKIELNKINYITEKVIRITFFKKDTWHNYDILKYDIKKEDKIDDISLDDLINNMVP